MKARKIANITRLSLELNTLIYVEVYMSVGHIVQIFEGVHNFNAEYSHVFSALHNELAVKIQAKLIGMQA